MSSDNQWTALGQAYPPGTPFGFYTYATNIIYGVNVQGVVTDPTDPHFQQGCGVYASAVTEPSNRTSQEHSRPGVWAVGDHYGVYGASNFLYDPTTAADHTPVLSPDMNPAPQNIPVGGIGVAGAAFTAPGVVGVSALTDNEASFANVATGLVGNIIGHTAGVTGISGEATLPFSGTNRPSIASGCAGVVGMNVRAATPSDLEQLLDPGIHTELSHPDPDGGIGVFGWSFRGRGGVFASASSWPSSESAPPPANIEDLASAQVRLVPAPVTAATDVSPPPPAGQNWPKLPMSGLPGDLMAVTVTYADQTSRARLWFCVAPGLWAEVSLGTVIPGSY